MHVGIIFLLVISMLAKNKPELLIERNRPLVRVEGEKPTPNTHLVHTESNTNGVFHQSFSDALFLIFNLRSKSANFDPCNVVSANISFYKPHSFSFVQGY